MPIFIRSSTLDGDLQNLASLQRMPVRKTPLAQRILERVVQLCKDDPEAWMNIGGPAETSSEKSPRSKTVPAAVSPGNQSSLSPSRKAGGSHTSTSRGGSRRKASTRAA